MTQSIRVIVSYSDISDTACEVDPELSLYLGLVIKMSTNLLLAFKVTERRGKCVCSVIIYFSCVH